MLIGRSISWAGLTAHFVFARWNEPAAAHGTSFGNADGATRRVRIKNMTLIAHDSVITINRYVHASLATASGLFGGNCAILASPFYANCAVRKTDRPKPMVQFFVKSSS